MGGATTARSLRALADRQGESPATDCALSLRHKERPVTHQPSISQRGARVPVRIGGLPLAILAVAVAALIGGSLGGCASTPPPLQEMAVAEAAVQRASTTSTSETAAAELGVAVAKLASARSALAAGNADAARRLANEATLDAQVAEMHAQAARSTRAARESDDAARVLREEINRKTPR